MKQNAAKSGGFNTTKKIVVFLFRETLQIHQNLNHLFLEGELTNIKILNISSL